MSVDGIFTSVARCEQEVRHYYTCTVCGDIHVETSGPCYEGYEIDLMIRVPPDWQRVDGHWVCGMHKVQIQIDGHRGNWVRSEPHSVNFPKWVPE